MDPFSDLADFAHTALSTVGNILNFNSTNQPAQPLQRGRNTPRPPQEEKHSTILRPQKPKASADEEESSASTRSDIPPSSEGAKTRGGRSSGAGISGYDQSEYLNKLFPEPKKTKVEKAVNSGKSSKSTSKEGAAAGPALTNRSGNNDSKTQSSGGAETLRERGRLSDAEALTSRSGKTPRAEAPPAGRSKSRGRTGSSASSGSNMKSSRSTSKGGVNDDRRRSENRGRAQSSASFGSKMESSRSTSKVRASDAGPASDMTPRRQNAQGMVIRYHEMPIKPTSQETITQMEMGNQGIPNGLRRQRDEADQDKAIQDAHDKARQVNKRATDGALLTRIDSINITYPDEQGPGGSRR